MRSMAFQTTDVLKYKIEEETVFNGLPFIPVNISIIGNENEGLTAKISGFFGRKIDGVCKPLTCEEQNLPHEYEYLYPERIFNGMMVCSHCGETKKAF